MNKGLFALELLSFAGSIVAKRNIETVDLAWWVGLAGGIAITMAIADILLYLNYLFSNKK